MNFLFLFLVILMKVALVFLALPFIKMWIDKLEVSADKADPSYDKMNIEDDPIATAIFAGLRTLGVYLFFGIILGSVIIGSFL